MEVTVFMKISLMLIALAVYFFFYKKVFKKFNTREQTKQNYLVDTNMYGVFDSQDRILSLNLTKTGSQEYIKKTNRKDLTVKPIIIKK